MQTSAAEHDETRNANETLATTIPSMDACYSPTKSRRVKIFIRDPSYYVRCQFMTSPSNGVRALLSPAGYPVGGAEDRFGLIILSPRGAQNKVGGQVLCKERLSSLCHCFLMNPAILGKQGNV
jgi:hypothetical protein